LRKPLTREPDTRDKGLSYPNNAEGTVGFTAKLWKLSVDWLLAGIEKLAPGGRLVMHTGVSIVEGRDLVHEALQEAVPAHGLKLDYRLLDPDIYGDELETPAYAGVDRIAAVGACVVSDRAISYRHGDVKVGQWRERK